MVEDDASTRAALQQLLTITGFVACTAGTVAEGLAKLDGQDCLILDLILPDGLGTTIFRKVRSERRPIRVAVYTGSSDPYLGDEVNLLVPDAFFQKPVNPDRLLEWLENSSAGEAWSR